MKKQRGDAVIIVIVLLLAVEAVYLMGTTTMKSQGTHTPYHDIHMYEEAPLEESTDEIHE